MTVWLDPGQVAERLSIARKTAMALMHQMPHSVISGSTRQRIRVSETDLEAWMLKKSTGKPQTKAVGQCKRRLERR